MKQMGHYLRHVLLFILTVVLDVSSEYIILLLAYLNESHQTVQYA